ncbi:MAG: T9SS type A sorting domain-containing protein [bacterium]|nr:T9SS type A sorting domain-containing protein [bacterium]
MKLKALFVVVALFALAAVSHAQFNVGMFTYTPLTSSCTGGDPLPDGTMGYIYWDVDNDGPDGTDPLPVVGNGFGEANFNEFSLNWSALFLDPGTFYFETNFTIPPNTPAPSRYYVRIVGPAVMWTSRVITVVDGYQETEMAPWTCEVTVVPCNEPTFIGIETLGGRNFLPDGATYTRCINFCAGVPTTICLGPLSADETPVGDFSGACQGTPTALAIDPAGWQYNAGTLSWCLVVTAANDGCNCFVLTDILSAENGSFDAVARDNAVELTWTTLSESEVSGYDVMRRVSGHESFAKVGTVEAANSASGSTYTFVDNGAVNGTVYEYTLSTVNLDGSLEAWGTVVTATPSAEAAVITEYALHQNYPNPFNPSTNLVFDVVSDNFVTLTVYNAMGQEVSTLVNSTMGAGRHTVSFDAANLTSGLYFYTVKIGNEFTATKKMLLVK